MVVALAVGGLLVPTAAEAGTASCDTRVNNTHQKLQECVTLDGVRQHQQALQAIADANGGTRVSGSPGYDQSVDYAAGILDAAGYDVTIQDFQFQTFVTLSPTVLESVAPNAFPIATSILSYSGSGDVTAAVTALPGPAVDPTPGCDAGDFAGFTAGNIALISRGSCAFAIKANNAANAGAVGVVIYNNVAGTINGTLGNDFALDIPVTSVTNAVGVELVNTPGLILR
jgi:aminopeptidase Y